jgi:hypothetical protein
MSNEHKTTVSFGGLGLGTVLTLIFLVLKLCGVIAWEWIYVFLPIIISFGLSVLVVVAIIVFYIIAIKLDWLD